MTKIAMLGTGRMGSALAQAFLAREHEVTVWNRTRERAAPLAARSARLAHSVREAVDAADVIVACINDYTTCDALIRTPEVSSALRGKLLVQLTSGSPEQARASAAWARENGVHYLDGAIMATPDNVGKAACLVVYAGERALFDLHAPTLRAIAEQSVHAGDDPGLAGALDSALLLVVWGVLFGALQGTAVSQAERVPLEDFQAHVLALVPAIGEFVSDVIQRARRSQFEDTFATLDSHHAALQHTLAICRQHELDRTLPDAFDRLMQAGRDRGWSSWDFSALLGVIR